MQRLWLPEGAAALADLITLLICAETGDPYPPTRGGIGIAEFSPLGCLPPRPAPQKCCESSQNLPRAAWAGLRTPTSRLFQLFSFFVHRSCLFCWTLTLAAFPDLDSPAPQQPPFLDSPPPARQARHPTESQYEPTSGIRPEHTAIHIAKEAGVGGNWQPI